MVRTIFFAFHFIGGFLLLWLAYTLATIRLLPTDSALELKAGLETAYLVTGVIWGNVGWDNFKRIPDNANFSLLAYILSRTLAPVVVGLPVVALVLDMFFQGTLVFWRPFLTWQHITLIVSAAVVGVTQRVYRKSPNAFYYSVWHA